MKGGARVERFRPVKMGGDLNTRERAALGCGCCIFVGLRSETRKAGTASRACSEEHQVLVELADEILAKAPARQRPLVDACVEALNEAASVRGR